MLSTLYDFHIFIVYRLIYTRFHFLVLLDKYIEQRKEMETLKKESESLESELDDLIRDFDEETKKYSKCGST